MTEEAAMSRPEGTISPAAAIAALPEGETVHVTVESGWMILGADWPREAVEQEIHACRWGFPTTGMAKATGHGLMIRDRKGRALFLETRKGWEVEG
jgi:hypothetical protein